METFVDSVPETKEKGHLSTSQRQAIINFQKKEMRDLCKTGDLFRG